VTLALEERAWACLSCCSESFSIFTSDKCFCTIAFL
jgi:hypothetical protein